MTPWTASAVKSRFGSTGRVALSTLIVAILAADPAAARPPDDLQKLDAAQEFLMQEGDCERAVEILDSVTTARKSSTRWIEIAARANECSGRLARALDLYRELDRRLPTDERRLQKIEELDARSRERLANREHELLARMGDPTHLATEAGTPQEAPSPTPLSSVDGSWIASDVESTEGAYGETYRRKLRLEVHGERARFSGHVFVEPELPDEKYLDGAVHWYEAEATGIRGPKGIEVSGVCTSKVWSFDRAGVIPGEKTPFSGTFLYLGDGERLAWRPASHLTPPCGIEFGEVQRSRAAAFERR